MKNNIPETDIKIIEDIIALIKKSKTAFITMHARPDGDALGAALALKEFLQCMNIDTEIISPSSVPELYSFMNGVEQINCDRNIGRKDIGFVLDCSDKTRLESALEILEKADTIVNIDHHKVFEEFGKINYIRPRSSSTSEMIYNIIEISDIELNYNMAMGIYIGILTDTNRFQEDNTSPSSHMISAKLIEKFISPVKISSQIYGSRSFAELQLLSLALSKIEFNADKQVASISISDDDLNKTNTSIENLEGLINFARSIKGVEVGILFREIPDSDGVKASFRSKGKVDVAKVASFFGGGGHHNASGCSVIGTLEEAKQQVIKSVEKELAEA